MVRMLFGLLYAALPALADWRALHRTGEQLLERGQPVEARTQLTVALAETPRASGGLCSKRWGGRSFNWATIEMP